ncbi:MAG: hypothetical protein QQN41_12650 [Nitrosopumilus sp.]
MQVTAFWFSFGICTCHIPAIPTGVKTIIGSLKRCEGKGRTVSKTFHHWTINFSTAIHKIPAVYFHGVNLTLERIPPDMSGGIKKPKDDRRLAKDESLSFTPIRSPEVSGLFGEIPCLTARPPEGGQAGDTAR